ncbi:AAA family ATPase, partial [Candidatus Saccharibacteria bacterium]|nr:AAA family ATPase [Candidatus Saccharibacteria bacterium]
FKLEVLEKFRNDPRYSYRFNDAVGSIYAKTDMGDDEAYIKSVGIAYDEDFNRAVCIFYTDLMEMTVAQQRYWKHFELSGNYRRHPDFVNSQILGNFPENASLAEAFTEELYVINKITLECLGKELFKHTYRGEKRPKELAFLIRPTSKELQNFIHLLDKLLSENINKQFFKGKLQLDTEIVRKDGRVQVTPKGSLTLLEECIRGWFKTNDTEPLDTMFSTFKKIRKMRTSPAHSIEEDTFDMKFFKEQRELYIEAYSAIRLLRLALTNHPKADVSIVPSWLYEGKINSF